MQDECAEIAMELDGRQIRMCPWMERVHVLRDDAANKALLAQRRNRIVGRIGFALMQAGPAQVTPRPVSLAPFVVRDELVEVDGPVALVLCVGSVVAAVVCQT